MRIRRPLAALLTAMALFGGGATLTACGDPAGQDRSDGTTDESGDQDSGDTPDNNGGGDAEGDDDQSNQEPNDEDDGDDQSDPD